MPSIDSWSRRDQRVNPGNRRFQGSPWCAPGAEMDDGEVSRNASRGGWVPLMSVSVVTVVVTAGFAQGVWIGNLHNGLLGLAFTSVGAYVLHQQPRNRCAAAFLATGFVEAVMFLGRQIGHEAPAGTPPWWGWLGVWPLVVGLFGATVSVILFPDGHPPTPAWRWVIGVGAAITTLIATASALWPVGYDSAGVTTPPPFILPGVDTVEGIWSPVANTAFAAFQFVWLVAVVARWRASGPTIRRQLVVVGASVAVSLAALLVGLVGWGSPTPGVLAACLVPIAAGWAIVHGQYLATHSALTWLAGRSAGATSLPSDLAAAIAESLGARHVTIWCRGDGRLHAVGDWPEGEEMPSPLTESESDDHTTAIRRPIARDGRILGELTVDRHDPLSRHEERLIDGYAAQAALILEHLTLASTLAGRRTPGGLEHLTPREQQVLELMARGLTNAGICDELHLSKKTVEPVIGSIFTKLGLPPGTESNRRVLAVLAFVEDRRPWERTV